MVDRGFKSPSGETKDYKIGICFKEQNQRLVDSEPG